jgi:hypothetical protein
MAFDKLTKEQLDKLKSKNYIFDKLTKEQLDMMNILHLILKREIYFILNKNI